jgi:hypothetical protein
MVNYQNGKIYKITNCIDNEVYIGSTAQILSKRWWTHKTHSKIYTHLLLYQHMNKLGIDKFSISLVENYPCTNKNELLIKEGKFIREQGTLNTQIQGRTCKEYHEDNKDRIKIKHKEWLINNQESIKIYAKQHRENNLERSKEVWKNWYDNNKESCKIRQKNRYENNKEKILEKNRETIECDICKSIVVKRNLNRHKETIKCKNQVN